MLAVIDPESVHTLVVLPLNVVTSMPVELEEGAPQVENATRWWCRRSPP